MKTSNCDEIGGMGLRFQLTLSKEVWGHTTAPASHPTHPMLMEQVLVFNLSFQPLAATEQPKHKSTDIKQYA